MKRSVATITTLALVATVSGVPVSPAAADEATTLAGLRDGLDAFGVWLGDLGSHAELGDPVPLTGLVPGGPDGLDLDGLFADAAGPWRSALAAASDLPDLESGLEGIGDATVDMTTPVDADGATSTAISIDVQRQVTAPLALVDEAGGVDLSTTLPDGLPVTLQFSFDFTANWDDLTGEFWVDADPMSTYDAFIDSDTDGTADAFGFDTGTFESVVGLTEIEVLPATSSLELETHADLGVVDADGNGRLAFEEEAADGTFGPGELTLPKTENVPVAHAIEAASGNLDLGVPSGITVVGGGTPSILVSLTDPSTIAVAANSDYTNGIGKFANLSATELLGGVGQLSNMLEVVQRHPIVDVDLPFVDLLLSQMLGTTDDLKRFVVEQTNVDDPATVLNEFGTAKFATVQEFLALVNAPDTGLSIDPTAVAFDADTGQLDMPLTLFHDDGGPVPLEALLFDEVDLDPETVRIGRPALGNALEDALGLTGLAALLVDSNGEPDTEVVDGETLLKFAEPTALVNRVRDVEIPWGVDLDPSLPCSDCDLDETLDFEEAETLPTHRRFFVRDLPDTPEFDLDVAAEMDASDLRGAAGFVDIDAAAGSLIELTKQDGNLPSLTLDLSYPSELVTDGAIPIQSFVFHFAYNPDAVGPDMPSDDYDAGDFLTLANNLAGSASLNLSALGIGDVIPILGNDEVPVSLSWPTLESIADVQLADLSHGVTVDNLTDPLVEALTQLNFALGSGIPNAEDALFATIIDNLAGLGAGLEDVLASGDLSEQVPFLAGTPGDLVDVFSQLEETADALRNGELPNRLRDVLESIEEQLDAVPTLSFEHIGADDTLDLLFAFDLSRTIDETLSLNSGDLGLPLAGAEVDGRVPLGGTAGATLTVPIALELTDGPLPATDLRIKKDSSVSLDVSGVVDDTQELTVSALGQELRLGPGGEFRVGFGGSLAYTGTEPGDYVSLSEFGSNFSGSLGGTAPDCSNTDPDVGDVPGGLACVNLPVFFNDVPATGNDPADADDHWLQATWSDFGAAPTNVHTPEDIGGLLTGELLSFASFGEGLSRFLDLLADALRGQVFGIQVPLIGDELDGVADVVDEIQSIKDEFASITALDDDADNAQAALDAAFDPVRAELDPVLLDLDGDSAKDFVVQGDCGGVTCDASHDVTQIEGVDVAFAVGQSVSDTADFDLGLKGMDFAGVTGGVDGTADWEIQLGFGVSKTADFYLLDDPEALLYGGADEGDELSVTATAAVGDSGLAARFGILGFEVANRDGETSETSVALTGDLQGSGGKISIVDLATTNPLDTFDPTAEITAGLNLELASLDEVPAFASVKGLPRVTAEFDLDWGFTADKNGASESTPLYIAVGDPAFDLGAAFEEMFGPIFNRIHNVVEVADDIRSFVFAPIPIISDLSRMFGGGDFTFVDLAEIFGDVDLGFLEDVDKVIRFASAISGLSAGNEITFAELAGKSPGDFLVVFDPEKSLQDKPAPTQVSSSGLLAFTEGDGTTTASVGAMTAALKQAAIDGGASGSDVDDVLDNSGEGETFSMPIVNDPSCILGMLANGDCIVLDWQPQELYLGAQVEIPFGPFFGVLYINIGGFAGAGIKFGMGFSTRGIRKAIERGSFTSDPAAGIGNLMVEGIFIHDFEGPELYVNAGIYAEGEVNAVVAAAGVRGGIEATLGFDLIDGPEMDGLVYLDEMATRIHNPLCLFEVVGFLEAFLQIYLEIGPCPLCVEESFELARVRLLDFAARLAECDTEPVLATEDGDTIRLNIGTRTSQRGTLAHITDEQVTVREIVAPSGGSPGRFSVSAFGFSQEYEGTDIWFNAGDGDDVLLFQGSKAGASPEDGEAPPDDSIAEQTKGAGEAAPFTAVVVGYGGAGNDAITTGDGNDVIYGGDGPDNGSDPEETDDNGKDQLTTGRGNDQVHGGPDNDQIDVGIGADWAYGEGGNDTINGGPGADPELDGGLGDDRVDGGEHIYAEDETTILFADGADTVIGGADNDFLFGGPDADTLVGDVLSDKDTPNGDGAAGGGDDIIHGETGGDFVYGGRGRDVVLGDATSDPGTEPTDDLIYGQGGDDVLAGVWGNDEIHGGSGADVINGSDGDDDLFGDAGQDRVFGDRWGSLDAINLLDGLVDLPALTLPEVDLSFLQTDVGTPGQDEIDGGGDDDVLAGDDDNDRIRGGEGDDYITGGDGRDFVVGDDVTITGSDGDAFADWDTDGTEDDAETLTGTFADVIFGGPAADEIYGEGGNDHVRGSSGDDLIFGNRGEDDLFGDVGEDEIYGGADDDDVEGGPDDDLLLGNEDSDTIYGQAGNDRVIGGSGFLRSGVTDDAGDFLYGGAGTDVILGDNGEVDAALENVTLVPAAGDAAAEEFGDDVLVGDGDEDTLHGQDGDDDLYGGLADDQLFGELGDDDLYGQNGHDYLIGDRGRVGTGSDGNVTDDALAHEADTFWPAESPTQQGAPQWAVQLQAANTDGGVDTLEGGLGDDHLYAGPDDDLLRGQGGDDWMEGNAGRDEMYGLSDLPLDFLLAAVSDDQDVMLGGSSDVNPASDKHDDGELVMHGNNAEDVMLGDNGNVDRLVEGDVWAVDPVTGGHARVVEMLDRERRESGDGLELVSGGDLMLGDGGPDRMFGQGGQDLVKGNDEDDQLQGNQDRDIIEGNAGDDDLIGGTDRVADFVTDAPDDFGDPDGGDWLFGGADADVITGDNAVITRQPVEGTHYYETDLIGVDAQRGVDLLDITQYTAANAGSDQISGGEGVDALFGQDEPDYVTGNGDDDYLEGNGAGDFLWGDLALTDADGYDPPEVHGASFPVVTIEAITHPLLADLSGDIELFGPAADDGQDDQIGGWSQPGLRDGGDMIFGDGAQDFQLGDNGTLTRTVLEGPAYQGYDDYRPDTFVRDVERFDVGDDDDSGASNDDPTSGNDWLQGDDEDDYQWGQDGDDALFGDDLLDDTDVGNDDMLGELDDDTMFGGPGEDAMLGDRGTIDNTKLGDDVAVTADTQGPMFLHYEGLLEGQLDRRVNLLLDEDGVPLAFDGINHGGRDFMRGGPDHDSMHGGFADDWMNGDTGADWLFGDYGDDVMWGGRGTDTDDPDSPVHDEDPNDALYNSYVDLLFGGYGEDVLDFRPRPEGAPGHPEEPIWREITDMDDGDPDNDQHHQGVDWIYGGWDRDVLQGDVGQNGPDFGDRLMDWTGAYNLYTRCNSSYGDDGDVRQRSPMIEDAIWTMAFGSGVGADVEEVTTPGSSAFEELGFVYKKDNQENSGSAHDGTPGHFFDDACSSP